MNNAHAIAGLAHRAVATATELAGQDDLLFSSRMVRVLAEAANELTILAMTGMCRSDSRTRIEVLLDLATNTPEAHDSKLPSMIRAINRYWEKAKAINNLAEAHEQIALMQEGS